MNSKEMNRAVWSELKPELLKTPCLFRRDRMHEQLRHVAVALMNRNPNKTIKDDGVDYDDFPETPEDKPSRQNWWESDITLVELKAELKEHVEAGNMSEVIRLASAISFKEAVVEHDKAT